MGTLPTINTYIDWVYDPITRTAIADLRYVYIPLGTYELEVSNAVLSSKGIQITNPETIPYTIMDTSRRTGSILTGGAA